MASAFRSPSRAPIPAAGTITIAVQAVGKTTALLNSLEAGDSILDVVGPLGRPSEIRNYGTAVIRGRKRGHGHGAPHRSTRFARPAITSSLLKARAAKRWSSLKMKCARRAMRLTYSPTTAAMANKAW
jgi:hypothetical protein